MIQKKYNDFIIPGEESSLLVNDFEVTIVKLTEFGINQILLWSESIIRKRNFCPFYSACNVCEKIFRKTFSELDADGTTRICICDCPCAQFGEDICSRVAEELLRYSGGRMTI